MSEWISGNVFIRRMGNGLEPGHRIEGHTHNFDHTSVFYSGVWRVRRWRPAVSGDGVQLTMPSGEPAWVMLDDFEREGPFHLLIDAGCRHEFTYLGHRVPEWMQPYLAQLTAAAAAEFQETYQRSLGRAWCIYSHRTPQGDISQVETGWHTAYG